MPSACYSCTLGVPIGGTTGLFRVSYWSVWASEVLDVIDRLIVTLRLDDLVLDQSHYLCPLVQSAYYKAGVPGSISVFSILLL